MYYVPPECHPLSLVPKKLSTAIFTTCTGKSITPAGLQSDDIDARTIAAGLSKACRFGGQVEGFYSVARHSLNLRHAMKEVLPRHAWIYPLLHDAAEAFLQDIPQPFKSCLPDYVKLEGQFMATIAAAFGLRYPLPRSVKEYDTALGKLEGSCLFVTPPSWIDGEDPLGLKSFVSPLHMKVHANLPTNKQGDHEDFLTALAFDLKVHEQFKKDEAWHRDFGNE